ncbi:hypothetical protein O9992_03465 [Vibrio lentus]|nr:hypothetical protein [Vibrio lentus]
MRTTVLNSAVLLEPVVGKALQVWSGVQDDGYLALLMMCVESTLHAQAFKQAKTLPKAAVDYGDFLKLSPLLEFN